MPVKYEPRKVLKKMAAPELIENLVTKRLTVNRTALKMLDATGILPKKELERIALKVIKEYKERYKFEKAGGATNAEAFEDATRDSALMITRIQQATLQEITATIKDNYRGEYYEWLPSSAKKPDAEHMKKYGKKYMLGKGEAPGDRIGCQCGMRILVKSNRLNLSEE